MPLSIRSTPSSSHGPRKAMAVGMLILHYTGMQSAAAAIQRLTDPESGVSAHYLIDEDGTIHRMVEEDRRAWHAGVAYWDRARDINSLSIGIELVNPGHEWGYRPFPEAQMAATIALAHDIRTRHPIHDSRILGHSDVAPTRKIDPGEAFDWRRLAAEGLGWWPDDELVARALERSPDPSHLPDALAILGYETGGPEAEDPVTSAAISAFQRHFTPDSVTGVPDAPTMARAMALLAMRAADPPSPME